MDDNHSLLGILRILYQWRKPIILTCLIAGFGTAGISLLLPNYFKSTTVFFAASPDQFKPELLFSRSAEMRAEYYGNENDIDRMLTLADSNELADYLIDSFNLHEHYRINPDLPKAPYRIRKKFRSYYEVVKTKRDALSLSFESRDRELAAEVANAAREKLNQLAQELIKQKQVKALQAYQMTIKDREAQLTLLGDSLGMVRAQYGIYNVPAQTEYLTSELSSAQTQLVKSRSKLNVLKGFSGIPRDTIQFLSAQVAGEASAVDSLQAQLNRFRKGLTKLLVLEKAYLEANQTLGEDRERTKRLEATYSADIPAIIPVENAEIPIVKSRPRRSIIVLAAGAIAFFFCVIGVLLLNSFSQIDWKELTTPTEPRAADRAKQPN